MISVHTDGELVNQLIDVIAKHKDSEYVLQEASSVRITSPHHN